MTLLSTILVSISQWAFKGMWLPHHCIYVNWRFNPANWQIKTWQLTRKARGRSTSVGLPLTVGVTKHQQIALGQYSHWYSHHDQWRARAILNRANSQTLEGRNTAGTLQFLELRPRNRLHMQLHMSTPEHFKVKGAMYQLFSASSWRRCLGRKWIWENHVQPWKQRSIQCLSTLVSNPGGLGILTPSTGVHMCRCESEEWWAKPWNLKFQTEYISTRWNAQVLAAGVRMRRPRKAPPWNIEVLT